MSGMTLDRALRSLSTLWKDLHSPTHPTLRAAVDKLRECGAEGAELAYVLDTKKTRLVFSKAVDGGFTLNALNAIFMDVQFENATDQKLDQLVALIAHEARHVQQGYIVDSIQQELRSYQTQARIGQLLNVNDPRLSELVQFDPTPANLRKAQELIVQFFPAASSGALLYAALPQLQPRGLSIVPAAVKQLSSLVRGAPKV